jgi:hypothetical protein
MTSTNVQTMRRQVSASIEADVLNHAVVTIPAKDWDAFKAWIARPALAVLRGVVNLLFGVHGASRAIVQPDTL